MGGIVKTGIFAHDNACLAVEVTRQSVVQGLANERGRADGLQQCGDRLQPRPPCELPDQ